MAASEGEREARKRRERRDSGSSHERKERRAHSEERPPPPPPPPPLNDYNRIESERRAERLSRARRPQHGGKRRRPRLSRAPNENDGCVPTDDTRTCAPQNFEYVVQQKPELCEETEHSYDEESARHEEAERARRGERNEPPRRTQPNTERCLEKITKKINVLKKKIAKYEDVYESQNGYPMPADDRMTDMKLARMYVNLRRLQAEKRFMKADPVEFALKVQAAKLQKQRDDQLDAALKSDIPMTDVVKDIEQWLEGCRQASGRSGTPESGWTPAQLAAEKSCVQRALLRLEAARGRPPAHSVERGAARHLYERYRTVKRTLATYRSDAMMGGTNGELATIHEHETMLFNTSVDSSSDSQEKPSDSSQETVETPLQSPPNREGLEEMPSSTSSAQSATTSEEVTPSNEGLHCLGLEDLTKALGEAKMLKRVLRRTLKQYELEFELQNNRKVQRDDMMGHEEEYRRYKTAKARIKLINALINKQKSGA